MTRVSRQALTLVVALAVIYGANTGIVSAQTCRITGTVYQVDGVTPAPNVEVKISRADRSGTLFVNTLKTYRTNSRGVVTFLAPRTVGTDTAYIHLSAKIGDAEIGQVLAVPSDTSATLETLVTATRYNTVLYVVPSGGSVDTIGTTNRPEMTNIENNLKITRDQLASKAHRDSVVTDADTATLHLQKLLTPTHHYADFVPQSTVAYQEGRVYYDTEDRALSYYTDDPAVTMNIGQEMWLRVRNTSGAIITNGSIVYINGATGSVPTIALAQADTLNGHGHSVVGVATHDIDINGFGYVTNFGSVRGLNTSAYGEGSSVYLSPDTAGLFTLTTPTYPIERVHIGTIAYSHNNAGILIVDMHDSHGRYALADSLWQLWGAVLLKGDSASLHAQKFALINDSLAATSLRATTTKNDLAGHVANISNPHSVTAAQVGAPTIAALSDTLTAALTNGARSISTTGRMFVSDDSITFVGEAGDVINAATGNVFRGTISANDTLSITNMVDGQVITVIITNAGTHTLGWSGVNWAGGTAPTLSATANKRDAFTIIRAGGVMFGSYVQDLR